MKRVPAIAAAALVAGALFALTGCGANLDREVTVHDMVFKVPENWLQSPEQDGTVSFTEENDDTDEDETANSITVSYRGFDETTPSQEAAEALTAKQQALQRDYGITAWSIDEEKSRVIDGAQTTTYEYSFVKEIAGEKRTYEFTCAYVVTNDGIYEIAVVGDAANIGAIVDSIEF